MNIEENGRRTSVPVHGEITTVLKRAADGYEVHVLGKNGKLLLLLIVCSISQSHFPDNHTLFTIQCEQHIGEVRSNTPLQFIIVHPLGANPLTVYLKSDDQGVVHLGPLDNGEGVTCSTTDMEWQLSQQNKCAYPNEINSTEGDDILVPLNRADATFIRTISLYGRTPGTTYRCLTEDFTQRIKLENGVLKITHLQRGHYLLYLDEENIIEITVASPKSTKEKIRGLEAVHLAADPMLEIPDSLKHPLFLHAPQANDELQMVDIQTRNWTADTRVTVFATKFVPNDKMFENMHRLDFQKPWSRSKAELLPPTYRTGCVLGEEHQYILNRKAQSTHWAGNLLAKPSILLSPWVGPSPGHSQVRDLYE